MTSPTRRSIWLPLLCSAISLLTATAYGMADIPKGPAKIVDTKKTLLQPNVVVIDQKIKGNDPLAQAANAYSTMRSRAKVLQFQHAVNFQKTLNGKYPSVEEFIKLMKENNVEFNYLPLYQMYGYDSSSGAIVILENKAEKAAHYKKAGIPLD